MFRQVHQKIKLTNKQLQLLPVFGLTNGKKGNIMVSESFKLKKIPEFTETCFREKVPCNILFILLCLAESQRLKSTHSALRTNLQIE